MIDRTVLELKPFTVPGAEHPRRYVVMVEPSPVPDFVAAVDEGALLVGGTNAVGELVYVDPEEWDMEYGGLMPYRMLVAFITREERSGL